MEVFKAMIRQDYTDKNQAQPLRWKEDLQLDSPPLTCGCNVERQEPTLH
jgi:hypothetical protein